MERLRRLIPTRESLQHNRWLRWLGPALFHPRLWHMSRRGIALGAAIGVFFAFLIPIAQIPLSAALAVALRANIPAAVAATLVNTPVTFPPVYYAAWRTGSWLLGERVDETRPPVLPGFEDDGAAAGPAAASSATASAAAAPSAAAPSPPPAEARSTWQRTRAALATVGKPLALGALVFACVFGGLTYLLISFGWHLRVRLKRLRRRRAAAAGAEGAPPPR